MHVRLWLYVLRWPEGTTVALTSNANNFHFLRNTVTSPANMFSQKAINQFVTQLDISAMFIAQIEHSF